MNVRDWLRELLGDLGQGQAKRFQVVGLYGVQVLFASEEEPPDQQIPVAVEELRTEQQHTSSQDRLSGLELEQQGCIPITTAVVDNWSHLCEKAEAIWRSKTRVVFRKNFLSASE